MSLAECPTHPLRTLLAVVAVGGLTVGCSEAPMEFEAPDAQFHHCKGSHFDPNTCGGGDDGPPVTQESIPLEIVMGDAAGDVLRSDGLTGRVYCADPSVPCYEDDQEFVGAHFSAGNNLMFWTSQRATSAQEPPRAVEVDVAATDGSGLSIEGSTQDRIYTNTNSEDVEFGSMPDGTIETRLFVEMGDDSPDELRFGVDCDGNAQNDTRVLVTRAGDTWTFVNKGGAYLCRAGSRKGKNKTPAQEGFVDSAPFTMTMTKVPS